MNTKKWPQRTPSTGFGPKSGNSWKNSKSKYRYLRKSYICWWTPAFISHIPWAYNSTLHSARGQWTTDWKSLSKIAHFTPGRRSNRSREIQSACKKMSQELGIRDGSGCFLPAAGLWALVPCARNWREACPQLDRAQSQAGTGGWNELSLNAPSGCKIRTAIKSVCQHTFQLLPPPRNRDYVMLKPWLRIQHLVSWTSSAAVSLRWHLRNGHKIHLILPTACETDIPCRRLAK